MIVFRSSVIALALLSVLPARAAGPAASATMPSATATGPDAGGHPGARRAAEATAHVQITDFGAVGDGNTLNTQAIQRAIDSAAAAGGGVVEIPRGTFRSGSIFLKPGVGLYLAKGAVLLGSNNIADYPERDTRIEGHFQPWRMALVNAQQLDHVRISGPGTFDGNGIMFWAAFWQRRKENPRATNLEVERPRLLFIDRCTDVRITGISLEDSGFWNLHLYRCRDVVVDHVRIHAPTSGPILGPSTDGIDIDSSQDVTVRHCNISVNDDDIALKGSKGPFAEQDKDSPPVEDIRVEDCTFGDGNGVITCGSEATLVRNITVKNVTITGSANLLTLKLRADTPQHYEHILFDGVKLEGGKGGRLLTIAAWWQFFDLQGQPAPKHLVDDITIRNVTGRYGAFGRVSARPGDTLRDITIENVDVTLSHPDLTIESPAGIAFKNVKVNGKVQRAPVVAHTKKG